MRRERGGRVFAIVDGEGGVFLLGFFKVLGKVGSEGQRGVTKWAKDPGVFEI